MKPEPESVQPFMDNRIADLKEKFDKMSDQELKDKIHKGRFVDPDVIGYLSRYRPSVLAEHMAEESDNQGEKMRDLANGIIEAVEEEQNNE